MGAGPTRLNETTVMQAAQGVVSHLMSHLGEAECRERGVVIGYDHRRSGELSSEGFAALAAEVCMERGLRVMLFEGFTHTPLVPFAVRELGAAAGLMMTASHNPAADNGVKVYWDGAQSGAQLLSPHDEAISRCIARELEPWGAYGGGAAAVRANALCSDPTAAMSERYFEELRRQLCRRRPQNAALPREQPLIMYTGMHGVGLPFAARAFEEFALPPFAQCAEQCQPDPTFPTVDKPNPEHAPALKLAVEAAERCGALLVLANDPDADRLAVAERQNDGAWHHFTGDQIGALLADWEWQNYRVREGGGGRPVMLNTAVSSTMLAAMANDLGFAREETLTGFKWLCNRAHELRKDGMEVLLSYEEAIGFCLADVVPDKDGVGGAATFAEMWFSLRETASTNALQHFEKLVARHGRFTRSSWSRACHTQDEVDAVFASMRDVDAASGAPRYNSLASCGMELLSVRDLKNGFDSSKDDGVPRLPCDPEVEMLTLRYGSAAEEGASATLTIRASGTEPLVKFYLEGSFDEHAAGLVQEEIEGLL